MPLLEVRDLILHYATPKGPVRAVDGVSFALEAGGEALGLIGESGSGKTSLGIALMRLLPRNVARYQGSIRFQGREVMTLPEAELRRSVRWKGVSMVFQGAMNAFNPVLRVGDQVAERMLLEGIPRPQARKEVERLLERVGLPAEVYGRYPHELSGGMKQRVVIAMALALRPPLVILDEPTSALDVIVQAQIVGLLKELKRDLGLSMLFITHDPALAAGLCDRVAVMYGGQIREQGSLEALLTHPLDPYTQGLLASLPRLHADTPPGFLRGAPPDPINPPEGCRFQERCPYAFEACKKPPELLEPAPGHQARCWLYHPDQPPPPPPHSARTTEPPPPRPVPPAGEPLLSVRDLKVYFRAHRGFFGSTAVKALDGVSLELARGETLAVVGESGSGKTTLGRATLRLLDPTSGRIYFDGQDITRLPERGLSPFRRRAQAIFQDPYAALSPYMSVRQIVEEPLLVHGGFGPREREARVLEALAQVRLSPAAEFTAKFPHQLSGGQRQRVGIARAMVLSPEYVVADEPVSMIDASSRAEILYLLKEIQLERGLSFLYITHDLATSRHFADRIAVLYLGRIVEVARAVELIERPYHPYTKALLEAVPEPDPRQRLERRDVVQGEPPNPARVPSGCAFHPRCPLAIEGLCQQVRPELQQVAPGHWVACHLFPAQAADNARKGERGVEA
jgi:peptide/nickel transport system ATP-binding protein